MCIRHVVYWMRSFPTAYRTWCYCYRVCGHKANAKPSQQQTVYDYGSSRTQYHYTLLGEAFSLYLTSVRLMFFDRILPKIESAQHQFFIEIYHSLCHQIYACLFGGLFKPCCDSTHHHSPLKQNQPKEQLLTLYWQLSYHIDWKYCQ